MIGALTIVDFLSSLATTRMVRAFGGDSSAGEMFARSLARSGIVRTDGGCVALWVRRAERGWI